jgi:alkylated DNA repair dioxygenase AlkB
MSAGRNILPLPFKATYHAKAIKSPSLVYNEIFDSTVWRHDEIKMFGKLILQPRLTACFGKEIKYSGIAMAGNPWTEVMLKIKKVVEEHCQCEFNIALVNYYRDGKDYMGYAWPPSNL